MKLVTCYNAKHETWLPPMCYKTKGEALTAFAEASNDPKSSVGMYPAENALFLLGEFDEFTGKIDLLEVRQELGLGIEFVKKSLEVVK